MISTSQLQPPDISAYRAGNTGVPYVSTFDSGVSGPHVLINALTHGNEPCGAVAVSHLLAETVRPMRGKLTLSFANVAAYERFDSSAPLVTRCLDEDLNRVWSGDVLDGPRTNREIERARELRPIVDAADYLLDIHSTTAPAPPMLLSGVHSKGRALARAIGYPAHVVADAGHAAGPRLRDYAAFGEAASPRTAVLVECGQHLAKESGEVAIETAYRFLRACDVIAGAPARVTAGLDAKQIFIEVSHAVTVASDAFRFRNHYRCFETVERAGTVIAEDDGAEIRTPYDDCVLVMPAADLAKGLTAVRFGRVVDWPPA